MTKNDFSILLAFLGCAVVGLFFNYSSRFAFDFSRSKANSLSISFYCNNHNPEVIEQVVTSLESTCDDPLRQQTLNVGLVIAILDGGRNESTLRTKITNRQLNDQILSQEEIDFEQSIITHVWQFKLLRSQIEITRRSDIVAQKRCDASMAGYLSESLIPPTNIALTERIMRSKVTYRL